jgi:putative transposase
MDLCLTIRAKLITTTEVGKALKFAMEEFNRACNIISELSFQQNLRRRYEIHHAAYRLIRAETNLPSQHVINAIAKVSEAYQREPDKLHQFKSHSSVRYDARTMVLGRGRHSAALTVCPKGRVSGQLQMSARMRRQLSSGNLGAAELVYRQGQFYLHISVTVPAPEIAQPSGSLGVDLGVRRVAVTSNRKFHSAKKISHQKACYKRTRKHLQANGSKSAKRALKRVSGRERRFVSDTNHCLSKRIVTEAKAANLRIVLEDLKGIRENGKAKVVHEWSFAELQAMISYKANRAGVEVVLVDPRYTSQMCSRCLHIGVRPDQSNFHCRDCGLQLNADLNGARSIALRHDLEAMGRLYCEYPPQQVNRPEAVRTRKRARQRNLEPQAPTRASLRA